MPNGQAGRKERGFFLFSDLLIITSIKRRSGTIKKQQQAAPNSVASTLETNKYKLLMRVSIEDLDIVKGKRFRYFIGICSESLEFSQNWSNFAFGLVELE